MQIYESCFGENVVKQIRREMKAACAKCAILETPPLGPVSIQGQSGVPTSQNENNQDGTKNGPLPNEASIDQENSVNPPLTFDPEKLHQAILAYRPVSF